MNVVYYKKKIIKIADVWFQEYDKDSFKSINADIIRLYGINDINDINEKYVHKQDTLVTKLSLPDEELNKRISKNYRYDIRRSERDDIIIKFYSSEDIATNKSLLHEFKACYDLMFKEKGLKETIGLEKLKAYADAGKLEMSVVYYEDKPIVFHSYVRECDIVRLLHSCSNFRMDKEMANIIGRANKRLHMEDFLHYKKEGIMTYDWGGIRTSEEDGITKFKKAFGGDMLTYYNARIPISFVGKIACLILNGR